MLATQNIILAITFQKGDIWYFILFFNILSHLEQLPGDPLVVHLDLGDHVAGDVARTAPALPPVEAVGILLANNLKTKIVNILFPPLPGLTLISCPSLKGSSSSQASGLGDMVGGS